MWLLRRPGIRYTGSGDGQVAAPRYFEGHGWLVRSLVRLFPVMAAARRRKYLVLILVGVVFVYWVSSLFALFVVFVVVFVVSNGGGRGRRVQSLLR